MSTRRTKIAIWLSAGAVVTVLASAGWWLYQATPAAPEGGDDSADYLRGGIRFEEHGSAHVHVSGGTSN
ncbi:hypothetical protein HET69_32385 [Streptomyces sp. CJ_13]|uniref:hypothetical protein n=1 Tax=Streptomyces TaxID=1883 RepID=UPI001BDC7637|nr:hypothetical protein [Streptomyces sp. CJ_13]MBT1188553.1 hypothetical protein [Streptomyces sp. CJ_13]